MGGGYSTSRIFPSSTEVTSRDLEYVRVSSIGDPLQLPFTAEEGSAGAMHAVFGTSDFSYSRGTFGLQNSARVPGDNVFMNAGLFSVNSARPYSGVQRGFGEQSGFGVRGQVEEIKGTKWNEKELNLLEGVVGLNKYVRKLAVEIFSEQIMSHVDSPAPNTYAKVLQTHIDSLYQIHNSLSSVRARYLVVGEEANNVKSNVDDVADPLEMNARLLQSLLQSDINHLSKQSVSMMLAALDDIASKYTQPLSLHPFRAKSDMTGLISFAGSFLKSVANSADDDLSTIALTIMFKFLVQTGSLKLALFTCQMLLSGKINLSTEFSTKIVAALNLWSSIEPNAAFNVSLSSSFSSYLGSFKFVYPNYNPRKVDKHNHSRSVIKSAFLFDAKSNSDVFDTESDKSTNVDDFSSIATDGQFIYLHSTNGLVKVGFGSNTKKGKVIVLNPNFFCNEKGSLVFCNNYLFYKSRESTERQIVVVSTGTLQEISRLIVPVAFFCAFSPLFSDNKLLSMIIPVTNYVVDLTTNMLNPEWAYKLVSFSIPDDLSNGCELSMVREVLLKGWKSMNRFPSSCLYCKRVFFECPAISCQLCKLDYFWCLDCHQRGFMPSLHRNERHATVYGKSHPGIQSNVVLNCRKISKTNGDAPTGRIGHSMVSYDKQIYLFGGAKTTNSHDIMHARRGRGDESTVEALHKDLFCYDIESYTWSLINCGGEIPTPRLGHCAMLLPRSETNSAKMLIYGGGNDTLGTETYGDIFLLDLETLVWSLMTRGGPARIFASAVLSCDFSKMYVFGGMAGQKVMNELYSLDLITWEWIPISVLSSIVCNPRLNAVLALRGETIVVYGGMLLKESYDKGESANEIFYFDLNTLSWSMKGNISYVACGPCSNVGKLVVSFAGERLCSFDAETTMATFKSVRWDDRQIFFNFSHFNPHCSCLVGKSLFICGSNNEALLSMNVLDVSSANDTAPLCDDSIRNGEFFCVGSQVVVCVPASTFPGSLANSSIARVFDSFSGTLIADFLCGSFNDSNKNNGSFAFDISRNFIVNYDQHQNLVRMWCTEVPSGFGRNSPVFNNNFSSTFDLLQLLLAHMMRFVSVSKLPLESSIAVFSDPLSFEPFAIEISKNTFEMIADILNTMIESNSDLNVISPILRILHINLLRWNDCLAITGDLTFIDLEGDAIEQIYKSRKYLLDILLNLRSKEHSLCSTLNDIILCGMKYFFPTYTLRSQWFLDTLEHALIDSSSSSVNSLVQRLSVNAGFAYLLYEPTEMEDISKSEFVIPSCPSGSFISLLGNDQFKLNSCISKGYLFEGSCNSNIVLSHRSGQKIYPTSVLLDFKNVIRNPVNYALVFLLENLSEVNSLSNYDNYTPQKYASMISCRNDFARTEPIAELILDKTSWKAKTIITRKSSTGQYFGGKYICIKLVSIERNEHNVSRYGEIFSLNTKDIRICANIGDNFPVKPIIDENHSGIKIIKLVMDESFKISRNILETRCDVSLYERLSDLITLLHIFQSSLLSRCVDHVSEKPTQLLIFYIKLLFRSISQFTLFVVDNSVDVGSLEKLLKSNFVGRLLPPLLSALHIFSDDLDFCFSCLPSLSDLLKSIIMLAKLVPDTVHSETSYLADSSDEKLLRYCIDYCTFESNLERQEKKESEENSEEIVFVESHNTVFCRCPHCNNECNFSAYGDLMSHLKGAHVDFVQSLKHESHFLIEILHAVGSSSGKFCSLLVRGAPISSSEKNYETWLSSELFKNGLELHLVLKKAKQVLNDCDVGACSSWSSFDSIDDIEAQMSIEKGLIENCELNFIEDFVNSNKGTLGGLLSRLQFRSKFPPGWIHPAVNSTILWTKAALMKHFRLTDLAIQYAEKLKQSFSTDDSKNDDIGPGTPIFVDVSEIPSSLFMIWSESNKMKEFLQKLKQGLIASGISINFAYMSSNFHSDEPDIDIYDVICENIISKAKFLVYELKAYVPGDVASTEAAQLPIPRLVRSISNPDSEVGSLVQLSRKGSNLDKTFVSSLLDVYAGYSSQILDVPAVPTISLSRSRSTEEITPNKVWNLSGAILLFLKSNSYSDPIAAEDKDIEKKAIEENSNYKRFINCAFSVSNRPSLTTLNMEDMSQFLLLRRQRASARQSGLFHFKELLQLSRDYLSVQCEIVRHLPFSFIKTTDQDDNSIGKIFKLDARTWHYLDNCTGSGSLYYSRIVYHFQHLLEAYVLPLLNIAYSQKHEELFSISLTCLSFQNELCDHKFLSDVKFLQLLLPFLSIDSSVSKFDDSVKKSVWRCFKLRFYAAFENKVHITILSQFQKDLIYFITSLISSAMISINCFASNTVIKNEVLHGELYCFNLMSLLLTIFDSDLAVNFLCRDTKVVSMFASLINCSSPRIQDLAIQGLAILLPNFPFDMHIFEVETLNFILCKISSLIFASNSKPVNLEDALESQYCFMSASICNNLALRLIFLFRTLLNSSNWTDKAKEVLLKPLEMLPDLINTNDELSRNDVRLHLVSASLAIMGGYRETIRAGCKANMSSSKNRKLIQAVTVIEYNRVGRTGKIIYNTKSTKFPFNIPQDSVLIPLDLIEFDSNLISLSEISTDTILIVLQSLRIRSFNFLQTQLRSRFLRVLRKLLESSTNVEILLRSDIGKVLPSLVQSCSVSAFNSYEKFVDSEEKLSHLVLQIIDAEIGDMTVPQTLAINHNFSVQFQPYHFALLPSKILSYDSDVIIEGKSVSIAGQLSSSCVTVIGDVMVPREVPSYYFEVTIDSCNPQNSGGFGDSFSYGRSSHQILPRTITVGLIPVDNGPIVGMPGEIQGSIAVSIDGLCVRGSHRKSMPFRCKPGDTMGFLFDRLSERIFVTLNGYEKEILVCKWSRNSNFYPAVGVSLAGSRFSINFGQEPFKWNFSSSKYVPSEFRMVDKSVKMEVSEASNDETDEDGKLSDEVKLKEQKNQLNSQAGHYISAPFVPSLFRGSGSVLDRPFPSSAAPSLPSFGASAPAVNFRSLFGPAPAGHFGNAVASTSNGFGFSQVFSSTGFGNPYSSSYGPQFGENTISPPRVGMGSSLGAQSEDLEDDWGEHDLDFEPDGDSKEVDEFVTNYPENYHENEGSNCDDEENDQSVDVSKPTTNNRAPFNLSDCIVGTAVAVVKPRKGWSKEYSCHLGRNGVITKIDLSKRAALVTFHSCETSILKSAWLPANCLGKFKGDINESILKTISHVVDSKTLFEANSLENGISFFLARACLLLVLDSLLLNKNIANVNFENFGGIDIFIAFLKRVIIDEIGSNNHGSKNSNALVTIRNFIVYYIESSNQYCSFVDRLIFVIIKELQRIDGSTDDIFTLNCNWRALLLSNSQEHAEFSCFLVEVLIGIGFKSEIKSENAELSSSYVRKCLLSHDLLNSLIRILSIPPYKSFRSSNPIFSAIFPILCQILTEVKVQSLDNLKFVDLEKLETITENMHKRWSLETRNGSIPNHLASFSRYTQSLCNIGLLVHQAKLAISSKEKDEVVPDLEKISWFEMVLLNAELMQNILTDSKFPKWFICKAIIRAENEQKFISIESRHPYCESVPSTKVQFLDAESIVIRLNKKTRSADCDVLRFFSKQDGSQEFMRLFGGKVVNHPSVNIANLNIPQDTFFYQFDVAKDPLHSVLCWSCHFPISGIRYSCSCCNEMSLCAKCEKNVDLNHNPLHLLVKIARPLPNTRFPNLIGQKIYESPDVSNLQSIHNDILCLKCNSLIQGSRYKCLICVDCNLCTNCEIFHEKTHFLLKINRPIPSSSSRYVNSLNLRSFFNALAETNIYWGYQFDVIPKFPSSFEKVFIGRNSELIENIVALLSNFDSNSSFLRFFNQLVEFINCETEKIVPENTENDLNSMSSRGMFSGYSQVAESKEEYVSLYTPANCILKSQDQILNYSCLKHLPIEKIRIGISVLQLLNQCLKAILPLIDWSLVSESWSLSSIFGQLRSFMFTELKSKLWEAAILRSNGVSSGGQVQIKLNNFRASQAVYEVGKLSSNEIIEMSIFGQLYSQANSLPSSSLRHPSQPWRIYFENEAGVDAGGLFRDSFSQICQELQSTHISLFIPCPNAKAGVGITLDKFVPCKNLQDETYLSMYRFIGKLMGIGIRTKTELELDLPSIVWKPLVGQSVDMGDLAAIDEICVKAINFIVDDSALIAKGIDSTTFSDFYDLNFTYSRADETVVDLKPAGAMIAVTWDNRHEYANLVKEMRLREFSDAVNCIREGLVSIVPSRYLSLLTWKELELEICGSPTIDINLLKKHTIYRACVASDPHILAFWEIITQFSMTERSQFLRFVWGRSRLPSASKFTASFFIDSSPKLSEDHLPNSHTCSFCLELPRYRSLEIMKDKLVKAITMCASVENV